MNTPDILNAFSGLSSPEKIEALVRLSHELTILGRDAYLIGAFGSSYPARLRALNEVQHRISSHVLALLRNDPRRYPDDVLVNVILEHDDDPDLRRQVGQAFSRILTHQAVA